MKTIHKYQLPIIGQFSILMPKEAEILHVREQGNAICLWARVDSSAEEESHHFRICGTGHSAPSSRYLGTALLDNGAFVFHVFEEEFNQ